MDAPDTCSRCGKVITDFADIAYLGPVDRSDTSCDPFAPFETVCTDCEDRPE